MQSLANDIVSSEVHAECDHVSYPRFGDECEQVRKEEGAKDSGTGVWNECAVGWRWHTHHASHGRAGVSENQV